MTDDDTGVCADFGFGPAVADGTDPAPGSTGTPRRGIRPLRGTRSRSGFRRRLTSFAVLLGALLAVGGGYAVLAPSSGADDNVPSAADLQAGRQLFNTSCITCHGANLQGVQGRGPSLVGVGSSAAYFQLITGRMPAVMQGANNERKTPKFTEDESNQIAAYIQSVGGGPQTPTGEVRGGTETIAEGGELFRLNCASCHGATGRGAPLSAGKVAPGLTEATDREIYTAMQSGPENMPVFSDNQITPDQKKAIIAYVQNMKASKDPGGAGLARIGPVSEGLVIWTIGIGLIVVAILWIGARA